MPTLGVSELRHECEELLDLEIQHVYQAGYLTVQCITRDESRFVTVNNFRDF